MVHINKFILTLSVISSFLLAEDSAQIATPQYSISVVDPETTAPLLELHHRDSIQYRKFCPYGAASFSSGVGVSWRSRNDFKGRALDVKAGVSSSDIRSVSCDYN